MRPVTTIKSLLPTTLRMRIADARGRGEYSQYAGQRGFIFIHIPKTGGMAIAEALSLPYVSHRRYSEYLRANPSKYRRTFKFSIVRNPWDRLVSAYFFLRAGGVNEVDQAWADRHLSPFPSFREFVREWVNEENVWSWIHFVPQHYFIAGKTIMVDYVARFETLAEDFKYIASRLGSAARLNPANVSQHAHFTTYYDAEMCEIVARAYRRDIELFGYGFRPLPVHGQEFSCSDSQSGCLPAT